MQEETEMDDAPDVALADDVGMIDGAFDFYPTDELRLQVVDARN